MPRRLVVSCCSWSLAAILAAGLGLSRPAAAAGVERCVLECAICAVALPCALCLKGPLRPRGPIPDDKRVQAPPPRAPQPAPAAPAVAMSF